MRQLRLKPTLSLEAIDQQAGDFYEALIEIIRGAGGASSYGLMKKGINKEIQECIKKYTNLTIEVDIPDSDMEPAAAWILVPVTDMNHSILNDNVRAYYEIYFEGKSLIAEHSKKPGLLSRVDIAKGKVYGDYANVVAQMTIGDEFFDLRNYSPEECAAIILHEVGHYFSYVEFLTCSITTNFVLSQLADALSRTTNPKERESYITAATQVLGNSGKVNPEELANAKDVSAVQVVLIKDYIETKRIEFGYDVFNNATWEAMADQFASRQGAGRALLTGLDKLIRKYGSDIAYRGKTSFYLVEACKVVFILMGLVGLALVPVAGPGGFGVAFSAFMFVLPMMLGDSANTTYGRLPVRYERVRAELVTRLKDRKIGKKEQQQITEDIEVVDRILKTVSDQRQWFSYVASLIFSAKREYYKAEEVARELEKFGANDFFLHSVKLKMLADLMAK
jgi:hypothetical protein